MSENKYVKYIAMYYALLESQSKRQSITCMVDKIHLPHFDKWIKKECDKFKKELNESPVVTNLNIIKV